MISRAVRAQARSTRGDMVLLWLAAAGLALSLFVVTSVPSDVADAPPGVEADVPGPYSAVLAMYGAVLAAVYGSFRYTIDRRDGVIAQRLMLQTRWMTLLTRVPAAAMGGAVVSAAAILGGHAALAVVVGGITWEWSTVGSALGVGALAALWGMGVGVVVQMHLVALFIVPMTVSGAVLVAIFWSAGAPYLPLFAMLEVCRFDVTVLGLLPVDRLDGSVALLVTGVWVIGALVSGTVSFIRRDVT